MRNLPIRVRGYAPYETFRGAPRVALNFETYGGERHSRDDFTLRPLGQLLHFPAKAAKRVLVSIS